MKKNKENHNDLIKSMHNSFDLFELSRSNDDVTVEPK